MNSESDKSEVSESHTLPGTDYVSTRDAAHIDCTESYKDLDKWLLALTGGGTALLASQLSGSEAFTLLHFAGMSFAVSICLTLWSKWGSYKNGLETINLIEQVWNESDNDFPIRYYEVADKRIIANNKSASLKDVWAFRFFILGMLLIALSFVPNKWSACASSTGTYPNDNQINGTTSPDTRSPSI